MDLDYQGIWRGSKVPKSPEVSIVILVLDDVIFLNECLGSLRTNLPLDIDWEIIVLTNGTELSKLDMISYIDDIILIHSQVNLGFGGGCNRAVKFAKGNYLAFLNDDAVIEPGWLESLLLTLTQNQTYGAVGSKILLRDGRLQEAGMVLWSNGATCHVGRGGSPTSPEFNYVRSVDYCSMASLLVRREAWDKVGGIDDRYYPAYYEDVDLCLELRKVGYLVIYEPRSCIRHREGASTNDERYRIFLANRSLHLFLDKWGAELSDFEQAPGTEDYQTTLNRAILRAKGYENAV